MLRLCRARPRANFGPDPEAAPAVGDNELGPDAEGDRATGRKRRLLKTILASGILALGLGALYLGWSGSRSDEPVSLRLLPQGRPPLTQGALTPPVANVPTPPPSTAPAPPPGPRADSHAAPGAGPAGAARCARGATPDARAHGDARAEGGPDRGR